jgi:hypothetical protein
MLSDFYSPWTLNLTSYSIRIVSSIDLSKKKTALFLIKFDAKFRFNPFSLIDVTV